MKHVVKRHGRTEAFDPRKIYASVYSSCLTLRVTPEEAEIIADTVTKAIRKWVASKETVSSSEIAHMVAHELTIYHPDAAYLYATHRHIS